MKGYKNALVYITGKGLIRASVGVTDGKIVYVGSDESKITEPYPYIEGQIVCPGFIDQHIHGAYGSDAMDGSDEALKTIAKSIASEGVTSFLATTMTERKEKIISALNSIGDYIESGEKEGARVLGVHLEGPFISKKFCGAQDPQYIVKPSSQLFAEFNKASKGNIRLVTIAPEEDDEGLIKELTAMGITPSAGHTNASCEQIVSAEGMGLKCITHTYNVQSPLHHREIGVVGSALLLDELYTECICDGVHISIPAIKLLLKNKPSDKFIIVSDSMRAKNLPDGESELGGQKVIVKNGEARLGNGALAGSVLKINIAIKNLTTLCGVELEKAIDFATINPAKNLGVDDKYGSIDVGKVADFAVINKDFTVSQTVRDGEIIFSV